MHQDTMTDVLAVSQLKQLGKFPCACSSSAVNHWLSLLRFCGGWFLSSLDLQNLCVNLSVQLNRIRKWGKEMSTFKYRLRSAQGKTPSKSPFEMRQVGLKLGEAFCCRSLAIAMPCYASLCCRVSMLQSLQILHSRVAKPRNLRIFSVESQELKGG